MEKIEGVIDSFQEIDSNQVPGIYRPYGESCSNAAAKVRDRTAYVAGLSKRAQQRAPGILLFISLQPRVR